MTVVVSDTSPLRALFFVGRLAILATLFGDVIVPPAVVDELQKARRPEFRFDVAAIDHVRVVAPTDQSRVNEWVRADDLDVGEAEAIQLALELSADVLLIDERAGTAIARHVGLRTVGVLGVLVEAKRAGLVPAVGPLLDQLHVGINFFLSADVRAHVLKLAGEV